MFFDDEPHGVFFLIDNKSFYASCEAVSRGLNPLKVPLVVLSEAENTNGGLILATSPEAKHLFHLKANVSRKRDLPIDMFQMWCFSAILHWLHAPSRELFTTSILMNRLNNRTNIGNIIFVT